MDTAELLTVLRGDIQGVNQRIDDLRSHLGERIDDTNERIDRIDKRFDQVDSRFEQVDKRFEQVDRRFEQVDKRLGQVDQRFGQVDQRLDHMADQISAVETGLGGRIDAVRDALLTIQQLKLQGLGLIVALAATSAVIGTFALQLFTLL